MAFIEMNFANGGADMTITPLWTNSNETSDFASQTISLDLSKYKKVEIVYKWYKSTTDTANTFLMNDYFDIGKIYAINRSRDYNAYRQVTTSTSGITFGDTKQYGTYGSSSTTTNNARLIPMQINGIS